MTKLSCYEITIGMKNALSEFFANRANKAVYYPVEDSYRSYQSDTIRREPTIIAYPHTQPVFNSGFEHPQDLPAKQLLACLQNFDIRATLAGKEVGPVITRYEINLPPGVKSSTLCNLETEIARSMRVKDVRVVEIIPGKTCIGIDTDNQYYT